MKKLVLFISVFVLISACDDEIEKQFDQASILENITDNQLLPVFSAFTLKTTLLNQKTTDFYLNPTETTLTALQNSWKETALQWKKTELFGFGPTDRFKSSIYFHPIRENLIGQALSDSETIDVDYVKGLGAAAKGLPALAYLIFQSGKTNAEVLALFVSDTQAERRLAYVSGITELLTQHASDLQTAWQEYAPSFKAQNTEEGNELDVLANQLLFVLENVVNTQLGEPLGKKTGTDPLPNKVEIWHSLYAKELLIGNLEAIQAVYTGANQIGFDDYLNFVQARYGDRLLSAEIDEQLNLFLQKVKDIDLPLQQAVVSNKEELEEVYQQGQLTLILIKADLFSALSINIAFTDNDGD